MQTNRGAPVWQLERFRWGAQRAETAFQPFVAPKFDHMTASSTSSGLKVPLLLAAILFSTLLYGPLLANSMPHSISTFRQLRCLASQTHPAALTQHVCYFRGSTAPREEQLKSGFMGVVGEHRAAEIEPSRPQPPSGLSPGSTRPYPCRPFAKHARIVCYFCYFSPFRLCMSAHQMTPHNGENVALQT